MDGDRAFEWDEAKAAQNRAAHGVAFEAVAGFDFATAMVEADERRDYGEARLVAIGRLGGRVHVLVFTERGHVTRVISLRKANRREIARYDRYLED